MNYILYDGECIRCNKFASFVKKRSNNEELQLVPLTSTLGKSLLATHNLPENYEESVVLVQNNSCYTHSTAVLRVVIALKKWWYVAYLGFLVPKFIREFVYNRIAKSRKKMSCELSVRE